MLCAIWYHLYDLKNVKNTHGGVLLSVKLPATLLKVTRVHDCFSSFLSCTDDTKSQSITYDCHLRLNWHLESLLTVNWKVNWHL